MRNLRKVGNEFDLDFMPDLLTVTISGHTSSVLFGVSNDLERLNPNRIEFGVSHGISINWSAQTATFFNNTAITIPESGTASPYPSTINVSGFTGVGTITDFTVRIFGLEHTFPEDIVRW